MPASEGTSAAQILREFQLLGIGYLNQDYHPRTLANWKKLEWKDRSVFAKVEMRLGHRWLLRQAIVPTNGGRVQLNLENTGFAPLYTPRRLEVVWLDPASLSPTHPPVDAGLNLKGRRAEDGLCKITVAVPEPNAGSMLGLRAPDPSESLREDGRYAVRLMNNGITFYERNGWNLPQLA